MTAGGAALAADLRRFGTWCFPKDTGTLCRALGHPRSGQRYTPQLPEAEERLTGSIVSLATESDRYGYSRITTLLQWEGWLVNRKRVERIWRQEGLKVPQRRPKRGRLWLNDGSCIRLQHPGHVWSYDFVPDRTHNGRPLRMLTVINECTRECLAIRVGRRLVAEHVQECLTELSCDRGVRTHLLGQLAGVHVLQGPAFG